MKRWFASGLTVWLLAGLACVSLATVSTAAWAKDRGPKALPRGTQIGVVNLLQAEVMHYHAAGNSNDSFLKIRPVDWPLDDMLMSALKEHADKLGLTLTALAPTESLERARESCFVEATLANGLPKSCTAPLIEQAGSGGVSYLIVMAPGLNDTNHAGKARVETVSALMRGWGFLTSARAGAKEKPTLFNEVELLLIGISRDGVSLEARQWGGLYTGQWQNYTPLADPRQIATEQLNELQPIFAALLSRQATELMNQVRVEP